MLQREDTLLFSAMLYECVTQECPEMLPTYIAIEQVKHTHSHTLYDAVELLSHLMCVCPSALTTAGSSEVNHE